MLNTGLKTKISLTLATLLIVSMLLINLVTTFLWQNSLLKAEIRHLESIVNLWHQSYKQQSLLGIAKETQLKILSQYLGDICDNILFYDGHEITALVDQKSSSFYPHLTRSYLTQKDTKSLHGWTWKNFTFGREKLMYISHSNSSQPRYSLALEVNLAQIYERISETKSLILVYIIVNALILTAIGFFRLTKNIINPIEKLINLSSDYKNIGDFSFPLDQTNNPINTLAFSLNAMLTKIQADKNKLHQTISSLEQANEQLKDSQTQLIRAEKMAAIGRLSAGLAHEIGNPLSIIQGYLELLSDGKRSQNEIKQFTSVSIKELERIDTMVRQLLDFSRKSEKKAFSTSVYDTCRETLELIQSQKKSSRIEFTLNITDKMPSVQINQNTLHQVLINCIFNSIDSIHEKGLDGVITITGKPSEIDNYTNIVIEDNGAGIPEKSINNIFDPFYTTKDIGKGTGLGLSVTHSLITSANGYINVESEQNIGTTVTISLPMSSKSIPNS